MKVTNAKPLCHYVLPVFFLPKQQSPGDKKKGGSIQLGRLPETTYAPPIKIRRPVRVPSRFPGSPNCGFPLISTEIVN